MNIRVLLANPLSWAVVGCGLAIASTFLVWNVVPVMGLRIPVTGFTYWHGKVIAGLFLALGLVLIGSYTAGRPAAWHAPAVGLAGAGLLAFAVWYQSDGPHREAEESGSVPTLQGEPRQIHRTVYVAAGNGLYAVEGVGVGLLVLSVLIHRRRVTTPNQAQ